jgi:diguanylate cyclase
MTDVSQGAGWWLASDGKWYPPHLHPGYSESPGTGWWQASDGRWYPPQAHPSARGGIGQIQHAQAGTQAGGGQRMAAQPAAGHVPAGPSTTTEPPSTVVTSATVAPSTTFAGNGSAPAEAAASLPHAPANGAPRLVSYGPPTAATPTPSTLGAVPNGSAGAVPPPSPTAALGDGGVPASLVPMLGEEPDAARRARKFRLAFPSSLSDAVGPWARPMRSIYLVLALAVCAYVVSVVARDGQANSRLVDGWGVDGLEFAASALCLLRVAVQRRGRAVALALGLAVFMWSAGDTLVTIQQRPSPSLLADICYLSFYPLAYWAIVLLMRQHVAKVGAPTWLDGAVAGLGAAAVCAAFAFHGSMIKPTATTTAMNLAYPIGDVLLLALVIGGTAIMGWRKRATWVLVALACGINAIGDTFNLLHNSVGASPIGLSFNATAWSVAILLMSVAVWMQVEGTFQPVKDVTPGFVLPGLAAAAGLVILTVASVHTIGRVAIALATASLVAAGMRMTMSVVTLRKMTQHRHRQSMTDELTGLGNRRYLLHVFDTFVGESTPVDQALGVLFVDLDGFKEVNDSFGHSAGDHVLRQIGPRLASSLRRADVLVRLGGDEFAVLLPGADAAQSIVVAERLAASLREPFTLDALPITISASIGIAVAPRDATDLSELLRCADAAMYRAKMGRSAFQIYDQAIDDEGDVLRLMEELRVAVDEGQLVLYFQPQLDLRTGDVSTVEALVRWVHPRLGMIPPLKFLPLAEEAGLMPALTARVLNDGLAQCAAWRAQGLPITVSVNVSPTNLLAPGFFELVTSSLARHGLNGDALVLEITETCIVSDYELTRQVVEQLNRSGVVTSIDDFGAGFTSLAHLANLAVGELKLDQTFVADLAEQEGQRDLELVRSTIGLGHALGLRVVAEGIETEDTLNLLASLGCDLAQGYLISKPVPAGSLAFGELSAAWSQREASIFAAAVFPDAAIA